MAITNKIETAVKRLLVAGKVCWLWPDEDYQTEIGWSDDLTQPNSTKTMSVAIGVAPGGNVASPSVATDSFTLPTGLVADWPGGLNLSINAVQSELSNYTGGNPGDDAHFMFGGVAPGDNYNRVTLHISNPPMTCVLNKGSGNSVYDFSYAQGVTVAQGATLLLKLDTVDGLAINPPSHLQSVSVSFPIFSTDETAPMCTKGEDYHDRDTAAFQVIASKGEEVPPLSGNYLVNVRVLCSAQADDGLGALAEVESRMDALRVALDTDDLAARITAAANGGLTVFPNSIWGRGVTEGVEGRKFSSGWEFTCMACEAVL